jgi:hypothetical protein
MNGSNGHGFIRILESRDGDSPGESGALFKIRVHPCLTLFLSILRSLRALRGFTVWLQPEAALHCQGATSCFSDKKNRKKRVEPKKTKEDEKKGDDVSTLCFSLFSLLFVSFGYSVIGLRP